MDYKHCSTDASVKRQRQFEQCLLELLSQKDFASVSISDLCGQLGLSRKTFYQYFNSKEGCLCALIDHTLQDFRLALHPDPSPRGMLEQYLNFWQVRRDLLDALYRNELTELLYQRSLVYTAEETELIVSGSDSEEIRIFLVSGVIGLLLNWHLTGYKKSTAEIAAILDKLVQRTLGFYAE